ncbi:azurin [Cellvibrio sp. pealriver]|uniref:azurin n=1 Tax=Cellvibrio sp. pealriver TaxID=1622269 RepID=UPI00066FDFB6|nr:azurin [Cellvibrio sp. pealriver]
MKSKSLLVFLLSTIASGAMANECSVAITSTDAMQYDTKAITVNASCKEFTVTLTHAGKLPKNVMGHNWVLSKTDDKQAIASEGMAAGLDNNYLKPGDARVIASTPLIGGGETTSVIFPVSKLSAGVPYTFFCSYPGHNAIMQGSLTLQ